MAMTPHNTVSAPFESALGGAASNAEGAINRVTSSAHDAVDQLAQKAGPTIERVKSGMSEAVDALSEHAEELGALQEEWLEGARSYVREHPLATVAIAVAAGVVISRMMAR